MDGSPRRMRAGSIHDVRPDAFRYAWDRDAAPALQVESGEDVHMVVRDASDAQIHEGSDAGDVLRLDMAHVNPISGPVLVKGARPGDVLEVELREFRPRGWGWTAIIPGFGLLADEFPDPWLRISRVDAEAGRVRFSDTVSLPYRPFPGTLGVAPPEPGPHPIIPPSRWGGNLDIRHLTPGVRLYLPVAVEGALFSLGDTHAAQGDGEVCGTAVETAMDVVVRLTVRRDLRVRAPQYHVPPGSVAPPPAAGHHVCTGVGPDLMEATRDAVRAAVDVIAERHGVDRQEAYALASVACDLRIHEVVDAPNWVVGCAIPDELLQARAADGDEPDR